MSVLEFHKPIFKRANVAAFSNNLTCPTPTQDGGVCNANKWKFVEQVSPFRIRYRCKVCGRTIKYDFSNNPNAINEVYGKNTQSIIQKAFLKFKHFSKWQSL